MTEEEKAKRREYQQRPEVRDRERERERNRKYRQRPEVRDRDRKYKQRPEVRDRDREHKRKYKQRPEVRDRDRKYKQRPEVRDRERERKTRWSPERATSVWAEQKGLCAICERQLPSLQKANADHCHKTGKPRAFLCNSCNNRYVAILENPACQARLIAASKYIKKWAQIHAEEQAC